MPREKTKKGFKHGFVDKDRAPKGSGDYPCIYKGCNSMSTRSNDVFRHFKYHFEETKSDNLCPWEGCHFHTRQRSNLKTHYLTHFKSDSIDHSVIAFTPTNAGVITIASLITSNTDDGRDFREYLRERIQSAKEAEDERKQSRAKVPKADVHGVTPYPALDHNPRPPPASKACTSHQSISSANVSSTSFSDSSPSPLPPQSRLEPQVPPQMTTQHSPTPYCIATAAHYSAPSLHIPAYHSESQATMTDSHFYAESSTSVPAFQPRAYIHESVSQSSAAYPYASPPPTPITYHGEYETNSSRHNTASLEGNDIMPPVAPSLNHNGVNTHFEYITPRELPQTLEYQVTSSGYRTYSTQGRHNPWHLYHASQRTPVSPPSAYSYYSSD